MLFDEPIFVDGGFLANWRANRATNSVLTAEAQTAKIESVRETLAGGVFGLATQLYSMVRVGWLSSKRAAGSGSAGSGSAGLTKANFSAGKSQFQSLQFRGGYCSLSFFV
jgi:hypothetical protein